MHGLLEIAFQAIAEMISVLVSGIAGHKGKPHPREWAAFGCAFAIVAMLAGIIVIAALIERSG